MGLGEDFFDSDDLDSGGRLESVAAQPLQCVTRRGIRVINGLSRREVVTSRFKAKSRYGISTPRELRVETI